MTLSSPKTAFGLAALALVAAPAAAPASSLSYLIGRDAKIVVSRASDAPTLTVKYSGAAATLVELRVNGRSLATRAITDGKDAGETNFTLALAELKEGENLVEVRLFDRRGSLLGTNKSTIRAEAAPEGPVSLQAPKNGGTVQGPVEMKVGFGRELRSVFVSFFVDSEFKAMTNYPPYSWTWDSTTASNGWHDLEAWAVDEGTETYKSRKVRVFVNNPGGRTERPGLGAGVATGAPSVKVAAPSAPKAALRPELAPTAPKAPVAKPAPVAKAAPNVAPNSGGSPSAPAGAKEVPIAAPIALGPQALTPTGTRVATSLAPRLARPSVKLPSSAPAPRVSIGRGTRLENVATFAVLLNDRYVEFDVAPRVDEGVPMTPFRHLIEKAGGNVDWANPTKTVTALAEGKTVTVRVGDANARVNDLTVRLETTPYLERGRTIVPLSFLKDVLNVEIEFDPATNHVLITSAKK